MTWCIDEVDARCESPACQPGKASDGGIVRTSGQFTDISSQCDEPLRPNPATAPGSYATCKRLLSRVPAALDHISNTIGSTIQFINVAINPSNSCERLGRDCLARNCLISANVKSQAKKPVAGTPASYWAVESGLPGAVHGYMDVVLHPQFAQNRFIYLTYTKPLVLGE